MKPISLAAYTLAGFLSIVILPPQGTATSIISINNPSESSLISLNVDVAPAATLNIAKLDARIKKAEASNHTLDKVHSDVAQFTFANAQLALCIQQGIDPSLVPNLTSSILGIIPVLSIPPITGVTPTFGSAAGPSASASATPTASSIFDNIPIFGRFPRLGSSPSSTKVSSPVATSTESSLFGKNPVFKFLPSSPNASDTSATPTTTLTSSSSSDAPEATETPKSFFGKFASYFPNPFASTPTPTPTPDSGPSLRQGSPPPPRKPSRKADLIPENLLPNITNIFMASPARTKQFSLDRRPSSASSPPVCIQPTITPTTAIGEAKADTALSMVIQGLLGLSGNLATFLFSASRFILGAIVDRFIYAGQYILQSITGFFYAIFSALARATIRSLFSRTRDAIANSLPGPLAGIADIILATSKHNFAINANSLVVKTISELFGDEEIFGKKALAPEEILQLETEFNLAIEEIREGLKRDLVVES